VSSSCATKGKRTNESWRCSRRRESVGGVLERRLAGGEQRRVVLQVETEMEGEKRVFTTWSSCFIARGARALTWGHAQGDPSTSVNRVRWRWWLTPGGTRTLCPSRLIGGAHGRFNPTRHHYSLWVAPIPYLK
jgi:hypothetical protein